MAQGSPGYIGSAVKMGENFSNKFPLPPLRNLIFLPATQNIHLDDGENSGEQNEKV